MIKTTATALAALVAASTLARAAPPVAPVPAQTLAKPAMFQHASRCFKNRLCREVAWEALKELVAAIWRATKSSQFADVLTTVDTPVLLGQRLDAMEAILLQHKAMTPALARHLETVRTALAR